VVIILPVLRYLDSTADSNLISEINQAHREFCDFYGFSIIDVADSLSELKASDFTTKMIQLDPLHPIDSFMYSLGANLRNYLQNRSSVGSRVRIGSNYFSHSIAGGVMKKNSAFSREVVAVSECMMINVEGELVGIETWSDGWSELILRNKHCEIVKQFNHNLSFNEIEGFGFGSITLESNIGKSLWSNEPSVNVEPRDVIDRDVFVSGLLFKRENAALLNVDVVGSNHVKEVVAFLIPPIDVFIGSTERFIKHNISYIAKNKDADIFRDSAVALESINLNLSYELMKVASVVRPHGAFIQAKLGVYKRLLEIEEKE
jgi:hypothetical protein